MAKKRKKAAKKAAKKVEKKVSRKQIGKRSQVKGKEYQKHVAAKIADHLGVPPEEMYSAFAGLTGADIAASREASSRFPFAVECKNCKQVNLPAWLAEAEANADGVEKPFALVFKLFGRRRDYVVLDFDEFLQWVS